MMYLSSIKLSFLTALAFSIHVTGAKAVVFTTATNIGPGSLAFDGQPIVVNRCTVTVDGRHSFASLLLTNGAVLTHSPAPGGELSNRLDLIIVGDLTVLAGCQVSAAGCGYAGTNGPGSGAPISGGAGGGGAHGGNGGPGQNGGLGGVGGYGAMLTPTNHGSAGGNSAGDPGGRGGGVVRLVVGGTLRVDGNLSVDGGTPVPYPNYYPGGGAGGSLYATVGTLAGSGAITARGGSSTTTYGGGGGGGRIALYYDTNSFSGTISAVGGAGKPGGAGTIFVKTNAAASGELLVDNESMAGAVTPLSSSETFGLRVRRNGTALVTSPLQLASLVVETNGQLTSLGIEAPLDIRVAGQALVTANGSFFSSCRLQVEGDLTIASNGVLSAQGLGYPFATNQGPGAGVNIAGGAGGGGGHGGFGGVGQNGSAGGGGYGGATQATGALYARCRVVCHCWLVQQC